MPCGLYYRKYEREKALGPIFIRKTFDVYHVCVQENNSDLYKIVLDTIDQELANIAVEYLKQKEL
jgi:hypothetical protein